MSVPPQSLSTQVEVVPTFTLPTLEAQGIINQSELQEFGPAPPIIEATGFCPRVLPVRVNECVLLLAETGFNLLLRY